MLYDFRSTALVVVTLLMTLLIAAERSGAAEIRVLSANAAQLPERELAAEFTKETGHQVSFTFGSPGTIQQKVAAGEIFDLLVMPIAAIEALDKAGKLLPGSRRALARVGIGVAMREGAPKPDLSTPEAFRKTLLDARSITYSDSSTGGLSGLSVEKMLAKLGIAEAVKAKAILRSDGQQLIADGKAEIGLYNVSEIPRAKGVVLAGPAPAAAQVYIEYDAAVPATNGSPEPALAFLKFLSRPAARARWEAAGLELAAEPAAAFLPPLASKWGCAGRWEFRGYNTNFFLTRRMNINYPVARNNLGRSDGRHSLSRRSS